MITTTCQSAGCLFPMDPSPAIIAFEFILILALIIFLVLFRYFDKRVIWKAVVLFFGILIFETYTNILWNNYHLSNWAYLYKDISWIISIGWVLIFLVPIMMVNKYLSHFSKWTKFLWTSFFISILGIFGESVVVNIGIRSYSSDAMALIGSDIVPFLHIPWAAFYYIPTLAVLVLGFFKFWELIVDEKKVVFGKRSKWPIRLITTFISVLAFDLIADPLIYIHKLPSFLNIIHDVNIITLLFWSGLLLIVMIFVDKYVHKIDIVSRYFVQVISATFVFAVFEGVFYKIGFISHSPSLVESFSGLTLPIFHQPIEVLFSYYFALVLIIGFVDYSRVRKY